MRIQSEFLRFKPNWLASLANNSINSPRCRVTISQKKIFFTHFRFTNLSVAGYVFTDLKIDGFEIYIFVTFWICNLRISVYGSVRESDEIMRECKCDNVRSFNFIFKTFQTSRTLGSVLIFVSRFGGWMCIHTFVRHFHSLMEKEGRGIPSRVWKKSLDIFLFRINVHAKNEGYWRRQCPYVSLTYYSPFSHTSTIS